MLNYFYFIIIMCNVYQWHDTYCIVFDYLLVHLRNHNFPWRNLNCFRNTNLSLRKHTFEITFLWKFDQIIVKLNNSFIYIDLVSSQKEYKSD